MLCFHDDGEGMDPDECADIITFGKSHKRNFENQQIGMYGNGLKSGSMRIGYDLILFTKKAKALTCLFLSRTFHEEEGVEEVVVPIPCFDADTCKPVAKGARAQEKHAVEMGLILKYSPFKTEEEVMKQFKTIDSASGTLLIVYNLKLLDSGEPELDVLSVPNDILLSKSSVDDFDTEDGLMPERRSFRAYAALLYNEPRMKVYIQGEKVRTKKLASCLYKPKCYKYTSSRFKARSENEVKKAQEEAKISEYKAKEALSKSKDLEKRISNSTSKELRAEMRKAQATAVELQKDAQLKKQIAERRSKSLKDPKTLNFIFGINLSNRNQYGMFVYNCSRLIKMYERVGPQLDGGVFCSGVIGIVDVPYLVLEPTHNKQDFADAKEYRHLMKAMGEHLKQYWKDTGIANQGVTTFWENFGYISPNWKAPPSDDPKYLRKRAMQVSMCIQCDECLKWRMLPFSSSSIGKVYPDNWVCAMNPDPSHNKCSAPEQKLNIPEGVLKKEVRTKDQKEKELAEEIKKKQEKLKAMKKTQVVTSSRQGRQLLRKKQEEEEEDEDEEDEEESEEEDEEEEEEAPAPRKSREPQRRPPPAKSSRIKVPPSPPTAKSRSTPARPVSSTAADSRKTAPAWADNRRRSDTTTTTTTTTTPKATPPQVTSTRPEPSKKTVPTKAPAVTTTKTAPVSKVTETKPAAAAVKRKASVTSVVSSIASEESDMDEVPSKKKSFIKEDEKEINNDIKEDSAVETNYDDVSMSEDGKDSEIGRKVDAWINKDWHAGKVVKVNRQQQKWKIKFDKYPKDKYDKWFDQNSTDLRLLKAPAESTENSVPPPTSTSPVVSTQDSNSEAPSSSTTATTTTTSTPQHYEEIAAGYRTCLRYFLPPNWVMDKEAVSGLSLQELAAFPLEDFFDHYEKGLRKLVNNFQADALNKQQEAESAKSKLSNVRKMIAKLLKSINEDFDIDPEADTDQVDELLSICVKQALAQQQSDGSD
ncbi:MORC family CW-type zinc finger protein 2 isoform X1 [Lingula anatina]|nr:MORC family CW-type zinc finger protein 2 isoform X1 [Lingula anatina]|eukprot:XP_013379417.1 MORC family CW-type zinc finger protein 2 isoform X1 [Lingula anatina]